MHISKNLDGSEDDIVKYPAAQDLKWTLLHSIPLT